jgi:serpin B
LLITFFGKISTYKGSFDLNKLLPFQGINTKVDYAEKIQKYFQSSVQNLDFTNPEKATETINKYVSDQTNAIIPEMFEKGSLDTLSKMVLVNAIYFKADWKYPFPASQTRPMSFNVARVNCHQFY